MRKKTTKTTKCEKKRVCPAFQSQKADTVECGIKYYTYSISSTIHIVFYSTLCYNTGRKYIFLLGGYCPHEKIFPLGKRTLLKIFFRYFRPLLHNVLFSIQCA